MLQDVIGTAPAEPTGASDGRNKCVMTRCDGPVRTGGGKETRRDGREMDGVRLHASAPYPLPAS